MRIALLGFVAPLAAGALAAPPADAQVMSGAAQGQFSAGAVAGTAHKGDRHDRRRHRRASNLFVGPWYDTTDFDANRSFDPDRWNDWWHERPWRSYPRWVQQQQQSGQCAEDRMWWSGSGWRC
jgi:hypothetical protein